MRRRSSTFRRVAAAAAKSLWREKIWLKHQIMSMYCGTSWWAANPDNDGRAHRLPAVPHCLVFPATSARRGRAEIIIVITILLHYSRIRPSVMRLFLYKSINKIINGIHCLIIAWPYRRSGHRRQQSAAYAAISKLPTRAVLWPIDSNINRQASTGAFCSSRYKIWSWRWSGQWSW